MAFDLSSGGDIGSGLFSASEGIYGRRPVVPGPIDYGAALQTTIGQNIAAIPSLSDLATQSTQLYSQLMETAYPGITNLKKTGTEQIQSFLRGEIPQDVSEQIQRVGAEKAAAGGVGGSPFAKAITARDLGLTSLSLIQGGLSAAERWIAQARSQTFDFSRMFYGPEDTQRQAENEWNRQWLASQVAAAPDPAKRGQFDSQMAVMGMLLSAYGGGEGYTGQYKQDFGGGAGSRGGGGGGGGSYFGDYQPYSGGGAGRQMALDYGSQYY